MILRNKDVLNRFDQNYSLLSSVLFSLQIKQSENGALEICLVFKLTYPKDAEVTIKFLDVQEYGFCHNSGHYFYNVESFKFFFSDGQFYICLDPFDESDKMHAEDNDFIISREIELT